MISKDILVVFQTKQKYKVEIIFWCKLFHQVEKANQKLLKLLTDEDSAAIGKTWMNEQLDNENYQGEIDRANI